jgi:hypothetical protein
VYVPYTDNYEFIKAYGPYKATHVLVDGEYKTLEQYNTENPDVLNNSIFNLEKTPKIIITNRTEQTVSDIRSLYSFYKYFGI